MKALLLKLAAFLITLSPGSIAYVNFNNGTPDVTMDAPGSLEILDKSDCSMLACAGQTQCVTANNHLADAGSPCVVRLSECTVRVGARARILAAGAGATLGTAKYQRVRFIAMRCPLDVGGNAFGVPTDDTGWPSFTVATVAPRCARAPTAVADCKRVGPDGTRNIGAKNVFPASQSTGTQCEPVECSVMYGDEPLTDL